MKEVHLDSSQHSIAVIQTSEHYRAPANDSSVSAAATNDARSEAHPVGMSTHADVTADINALVTDHDGGANVVSADVNMIHGQ